MRWFGPSKEEIWRQLAQEISADFVDGGFWKRDRVEARHQAWTLVLDTYVVSSGKHTVTYTRLRAPYVNQDGFRFTIYQHNIFNDIGKFFGMQDVTVGHPEFDRDFVIQGNDEGKLKALFANPTLRELIRTQPDIHLQVKNDNGFWEADFPEGVDQLYFRAYGVIKDLETLRSLYLLFAETLNELCRLGSAYESDPNVSV